MTEPMTEKSSIARNPPPPQVGDVCEGPEIGHGVPVRTGEKGLYFVRAVVDHETDPEYDHLYQVVFRFWHKRKGWRYIIESAFAFGFGMYVKTNKTEAEAEKEAGVGAGEGEA